MIGYVAATGDFGIEPGTLFAVQFMWQFPHFWAIAWLAHDDYQKVGYHMLPFRGGSHARKCLANPPVYSVLHPRLSLALGAADGVSDGRQHRTCRGHRLRHFISDPSMEIVPDTRQQICTAIDVHVVCLPAHRSNLLRTR